MTSIKLTQAEVQRILDADGEHLPADLKTKLEAAIPLTNEQMRNMASHLRQSLDLFVQRAPADVYRSPRYAEAVDTAAAFFQDLYNSLDPAQNDE